MPRIDPESRRREIVSAALKLFERDGFDSVRVEDILQEVGLSKGGFYHHFRSREDILRQIVVNETNDLVARINKELTGNDPVSDMISLFTVGSLNFGGEVGVLKTLDSFASKTIYLDEMETRFSIHLKPLIARIVATGVESKIFSDVDCNATAEIVIAVNGHGNRCAVLGALDESQLKDYNTTALQILGTHLGIAETLSKLASEMVS